MSKIVASTLNTFLRAWGGGMPLIGSIAASLQYPLAFLDLLNISLEAAVDFPWPSHHRNASIRRHYSETSKRQIPTQLYYECGPESADD